MTSDASPPILINSTSLYLEIPETSQPALNSAFSTAGAHWRAHLNQRCLDTFLPWLREEYAPTARVWTNSVALSSFWELVNGTAIEFDETRLVLVPTTAIDLDELRVPQEWVDIPTWAADYYLAVQVNTDDGWIQIFGYTTHHQLKAKGTYDDGDRTYCLDADDLVHDINLLWITHHLGLEGLEEPLRTEIDPLPPLPLAQAENLLARLGNSNLVFPRLAVPFQLWGALLEHGGWRQRLYERRQGLPEQRSIRQWLQAGISNLAQQIGWRQIELQPVRSRVRSIRTGLSRQLAISGSLYQLRIIPRGIPEEPIWCFELRCLEPNSLIPQGFKLRLLSEDLQPFENNEDAATTDIDQLVVEVIMQPGEGLVWEIEPLPDDYDREVLRF